MNDVNEWLADACHLFLYKAVHLTNEAHFRDNTLADFREVLEETKAKLEDVEKALRKVEDCVGATDFSA